MPKELITELQAREILSTDIQPVVEKAQDAAGRLIAEIVEKNGDNYITIFRNARTILNAYVAELTYTKMG